MKPWTQDPRYYAYDNRVDRYVPSKGLWRFHRRRHWLFIYARSKGCAHCGPKQKGVLTFDHLDPSKKSANITQPTFLMPLKNHKAIIEEVRKCQILCHNCHNVKTVLEGDSGGPKCAEQRERDFNDYIHRR